MPDRHSAQILRDDIMAQLRVAGRPVTTTELRTNAPKVPTRGAIHLLAPLQEQIYRVLRALVHDGLVTRTTRATRRRKPHRCIRRTRATACAAGLLPASGNTATTRPTGCSSWTSSKTVGRRHPQVAAAAPKQPPPQAPPSPSAPAPSGLAGPGFGQCVGEQFKDNIGKNMVKNGFENAVETGIEGAIGGAAVGAIVSPEAGGLGALPGAVLGFVGGFGKGLLVDAPIETAADAVGECNK